MSRKLLFESLAIVLLSISIYFNPSQVLASNIRLDFLSSDEVSSWEKSSNSNITINNGGLSVDTSSNYPPFFLYTLPTLPNQYYSSIEFNIRFTRIGYSGIGLAISDNGTYYGQLLDTPYKMHNYALFYIWQQTADPYLHIYTSLCPEDNTICDPNTNMSMIYSSLTTDSDPHEVLITNSDGKYKFYLDDSLKFTSSATDRVIKYIWGGNTLSSFYSDSWTSYELSYLYLDSRNISYQHYLSQKDPAWAADEYDSASSWASNGKTGIDRWGCALTSVSMLLNSYSVQMPDGSQITPKALNTWLLQEDDGYIGDGLVNWIAITRLVRESRIAGKSETDVSFERRQYYPSSLELPAILNEPGHFILGLNQEGDKIKIADPNNEERTEVGVNSNILKEDIFRKTNTDLSYFLISKSNGLDITLKDKNGVVVPVDYYTEHIHDDVDGSADISATIGLKSTPSKGYYKLYLVNESAEEKQASIYLYDINGEVKIFDLLLPAYSKQTLIFYYNKDHISESFILDKDKILNYLVGLRQKKTPYNGIFQAVFARFNNLLSYVGEDPSELTQYSTDLLRYVNQQKAKIGNEKETIVEYIQLLTL